MAGKQNTVCTNQIQNMIIENLYSKQAKLSWAIKYKSIPKQKYTHGED